MYCKTGLGGVEDGAEVNRRFRSKNKVGIVSEAPSEEEYEEG